MIPGKPPAIGGDYKQGDIVLYSPPIAGEPNQPLLFVQSGSEQANLRPWIVMSKFYVHQNLPTVVGVPLTTNMKKANSHRIQLPAEELINTVGQNKLQMSVALCDHVRVLDVNGIRLKIGRLSDSAILAVQNGLAYLFDLPTFRQEPKPSTRLVK